MTDLYLAVGHGIEPNGVYDPGAVAADGTQEHTLATAVCTSAAAALNRSGLNFVWESNAGAGHDPDFIGSTSLANQAQVRVGVEVHFDANNAPRGGFGLYVSDDGSRLCDCVMSYWSGSRRSNMRRTDLYFLNVTKMPAIIWECDRTMAQPDLVMLVNMGEAIAHGICDFLGHPFVGPSGGPVQQDFNYTILGNVISQYEPPEGGVLLFTDRGFVYAWGHAQFHGAPGGNPDTHWEDGHRVGAKIKAPDPNAENEAGPHYVCIDTAGEKYNY